MNGGAFMISSSYSNMCRKNSTKYTTVFAVPYMTALLEKNAVM
jgi:hypothetical protein